MTTASQVGKYISDLTITEGQLAGSRFDVADWQRRFINGAFRSRVHRAALSVGRGAGKTTLCAAIACAALNGPLARQRGQVYIVAASFRQARIAFDHVKAFLRPCIDSAPRDWRIQDSVNSATIEYRPLQCRVSCIGSRPELMHGISPHLILADEPAQWAVQTRDKAHNALVTSLGKQADGRMICLGTQPVERNHFFSLMLHDTPSGTYAQLHAAADDEITESNLRLANPHLADAPLPDVLATELKNAQASGDAALDFKAYRLNLGSSETPDQPLLDATTWQRLLELPSCDRDGAAVFGVDLGGGFSWSAVAAFHVSGHLDALAMTGTVPPLIDREKRDRVAQGSYQRMHERGELLLAPGRVPHPADLLQAAMQRWGQPSHIVCDRYRQSELLDALVIAGVSPQTELVWRGFGYVDGCADVRDFRYMAINDRVRPADNLMLASGMAAARLAVSPSGDFKLRKSSNVHHQQPARDDGAMAALLAVAHGKRLLDAQAAGDALPPFRVHDPIRTEMPA